MLVVELGKYPLADRALFFDDEDFEPELRSLLPLADMLRGRLLSLEP